MFENKKRVVLWTLAFWNILAFFISYSIGHNYLITGAFFLGIPAVFLSWMRPSIIKKTSAVSLVFVIPLVTIASYLAHKDGSWYDVTVTGVRFFDAYPLDDFIWGFLYAYFIIAFYEYFFEHEKVLRTPKIFSKYWKIALSISVLFSVFVWLFPELVVVPYFYIWFVLLMMILLPGLILAYHPTILEKITKTGLYFLFLSLLHEYVAVTNGNWFFPGQHFIGYVELFDARIPFEEFLWLLLAVPAVLCYYEFFADDRR